MSLASVRHFVVPLGLVDQTLVPLEEAGQRSCEAFVLWGGQLDKERAELLFVSAYVPQQTTSITEHGLLVVVQGEALHRANLAFYEADLILAGQVHSHPTEAFHSDTDDTYPLMTVVGGLSAVVPNFGRGGRTGLDHWAWYRLVGRGEWESVNVEGTITFVE